MQQVLFQRRAASGNVEGRPLWAPASRKDALGEGEGEGMKAADTLTEAPARISSYECSILNHEEKPSLHNS